MFADFSASLNGLEFSDDMFNKLSKGSAYFVRSQQADESYVGKQIQATVKYDKPDDAKKAAELVAIAGGKARV
jgi:hypothetical protein